MGNALFTIKGKEEVSQEMQKVEQSIDGVSAKADELKKVAQKLDEMKQKSIPAKRELRELQQIMANMNLKGLTNTDEFTRAAERAGELKDAIQDAAEAVRIYSSDTFSLDASVQAFQGVAAAGSIATGVMGLFGTENEKVQQILLKVQAAQGILNGVNTIANMLNQNSIVILKLKQIQLAVSNATIKTNTTLTKANTAVETIATAKTKISTVAQTAWNVAKAIAKALLGDFSGLLLVGIGVLGTYAAATAMSTDAQEDANDAVEEAKKKQEEYKQALEDTRNSVQQDMIGTFQRLRLEFMALNEEGASKEDLQKWIDKNASSFQHLGLAITDVESASNLLLLMSDQVIDAFVAQSNAAVTLKQAMDGLSQGYKRADGTYVLEGVVGGIQLMDQYVHQMRQVDKKMEDLNSKYGKIKTNTTIKRPTTAKPKDYKADYTKEINLLQDQYNKGLYTELEYRKKLVSVEQTYLNNLLKEGKATIADVDRLKNAQAAANQLEINTEHQEKLNQLETEHNHGLLTDVEYASKIADALGELYQENLKNGTATQEMADNFRRAQENAKALSNTVKDDLEAELEKIVKQLESGTPMTIEARTKLMNDANRLQRQIDNISRTADLTIPAKIEPKYITKGSWDDIVQSTQNGISQINDIADQYDLGLIDYDTATKRISNINKQLVALGAKPYMVEIESEFGKNLQAFINGAGEFNNIIGSVDGCVNAFDRLNTSIEEGANGWEIFMNAINACMSVIQTITTVMTILDAIETAANTTKAIGSAQADKSAASNIADSAAKDVNVASTTALGIASAAATAPVLALSRATTKLAAAQIFQAHASIPWVGPPYAAAMTALMEGVIAAAGSFADGGIITGSRSIGDNLVARVNAGEMILNTRQQKNLFRMLDEGVQSNNRVQVIGGEIKLRGSDLVICMKNETKKTNLIR